MKKPLNLSVGEKTINQLKELSAELDLSVSAFVTMLTHNYVKEQEAIKMFNNQKLIQIITETIEKEKQDK